MAEPADTLSTTLGTCTACSVQRPPGWGSVVTGAVVMALAGAVALYLGMSHGADPLAGVAWGVAAVVGAPLVIWGLYRVLTFESGFAKGTLKVARDRLAQGESVEVSVSVRPLHSLNVRMASVELQAIEVIDGDEEKIVRVAETKLQSPPRLREDLSKTVSVAVPRDWPATMQTPSDVKPSRQIRTRVRAAMDFDAHPLFVLDAPVTVLARS